jgi:hypothetical protein
VLVAGSTVVIPAEEGVRFSEGNISFQFLQVLNN